MAGEPDPATGMVLDLKELKEILEREVTQRMDHRFLNYEVPELKGQIPTCENIARVIWNLLEPKIHKGRCRASGCTRRRICSRTCFRNGAEGALMDGTHSIELGRRYRFFGVAPAAQRSLSEEENQRVYGKCNNPYGHGHNYTVEVRVSGTVDPATGMIANLADLDGFVERGGDRALDHRLLNEEVAAFRGEVPTTENLCMEIFQRLKHFPNAKLERVRVEETCNNSFEYAGEELPDRVTI